MFYKGHLCVFFDTSSCPVKTCTDPDGFQRTAVAHNLKCYTYEYWVGNVMDWMEDKINRYCIFLFKIR